MPHQRYQGPLAQPYLAVNGSRCLTLRYFAASALRAREYQSGTRCPATKWI